MAGELPPVLRSDFQRLDALLEAEGAKDAQVDRTIAVSDRERYVPGSGHNTGFSIRKDASMTTGLAIFTRLPALMALAPAGNEPPFGVTQLLLLAMFVLLGRVAVKGFRAEPSIGGAAT